MGVYRMVGHACMWVYSRHHSPLIRIGGGDTSPKNMKAVFKLK